MLLAPVDEFVTFGTEEMGLFFEEDESGTRVVRIEWGQIGRAEPGDWIPYSTADDGVKLRDHARIFFNHRRSLFALSLFLSTRTEKHMTDGFDVDNAIAATYDGETLVYSTGEDEPFPALALTPHPNQTAQPLTRQERSERWEQAESWAFAMEELLLGDIDSLLDLQDEDLLETREFLCRLLDTEWAIAAERIANLDVPAIRENPYVFYRELAVQELLLLNEYLVLMSSVLDQPEINWLDGDGVNRDINANDGVTSVAEYLGMWQGAGLDLISRFASFSHFAEPIE